MNSQTKVIKTQRRWIHCLAATVFFVALTLLITLPNSSVYAAQTKGNWIDHASSSFAGGKGTFKKPYLIKTAEQLAYLAKIVNKSNDKESNYTKFRCYKVIKDIDLSKHYWTPIGKTDGDVYLTLLKCKAFRGYFDGGNHTIKGLKLTKAKRDYP